MLQKADVKGLFANNLSRRRLDLGRIHQQIICLHGRLAQGYDGLEVSQAQRFGREFLVPHQLPGPRLAGRALLLRRS